MSARIRSLGWVALSGLSSVIGPAAGSYPYRWLAVASTAPLRSAAPSSAAANGGQSVSQRWYAGFAQL